MSQQFCLKWNNHMNNMMDVFKSLLSTETMVDVTLACDGKSLKAHKVVLSACSPYFQTLFLENPCKHPIVILKDMKYTELSAIIQFMYHGEVNVAQDQLSALMKTAETLRVKGLAEMTNEKNQSEDETSQHRSVSRPSSPRKRKRNRKRSISDQSDDGPSDSVKNRDSDIEEVSCDIDSTASYPVPSKVPSRANRTDSFLSQPEQPVEQNQINYATKEIFSNEPQKLLRQTLTEDDVLPRRSVLPSAHSNTRLSESRTDVLVPVTSTPLSSSAVVPIQQPLLDIKPEILDLEPPESPVAGPSHIADESSMTYMDQSNMSTMSEPSGYEENSSLVATDSQQAVYYIS